MQKKILKNKNALTLITGALLVIGFTHYFMTGSHGVLEPLLVVA